MTARACIAIVLCLLAATRPALPAESLASRYRDQLKALDETRLNEEKTRAARDLAEADARRLREQLIANAETIQTLETALAETEAALPDLNRRLNKIEGDFTRDRAKVARLLAVLQRLDADVPPALVVKPEDSLAATRGAMQLGTVLPALYTEAASLSKQLKLLEEARNAQAAKLAEQRTQSESLHNARNELDRLLSMRRQERESASQKLSELQGIEAQFAKSTSDLKGLMERIAALRNSGGSGQNRVVSATDTKQQSKSPGILRVPVSGRSVPGDPSGPGSGTPQKRAGLWFESASGSQAVAPADSQVVFAGAYQNFGLVLILEMNGGYHLTLAGLGRIDVRIGDQVLAGEPVGTLAQAMPARLYLELRRNGQTMDPVPWLGAELRKAKGT
jgi:septal ring factor EnvC (AmiA/AmiB activator)